MEAAKGRWRPILLTAIFTGLRASELRGLALGGRGLRQARASRPPAGRPLSANRQAEVRVRRAHRSANAHRRQHASRMEARLSEERGRACLPDKRRATSSTHTNIVERGLVPTLIAASVTVDGEGRGRHGVELREVHRPSRLPSLLCVMVHQPARGRRPRASGEGRTGAARPLVDHDDDGRLRPPVPARRRLGGACGGGAVASGIGIRDINATRSEFM